MRIFSWSKSIMDSCLGPARRGLQWVNLERRALIKPLQIVGTQASLPHQSEGETVPTGTKTGCGPPRALAHRWLRWHCPVGGSLKVAPRLHWICSHDLAGAEGEELLADRTCWGKYMSSLELVKEVLEAARNSEFSGCGSTMKAKHWLSVMM